jgi:acyl carrier protein phosphodiesterase
MNHTAHCLLSFPDTQLLLGNFIGDYIKGRTWEHYPPGVQRGILLHRAIDGFTDNHAAVRTSVARVRPFAGRYAAPVVDVLYDHLLCRAWERYVPVPFEDFAEWAYQGLEEGWELMPLSLQKRWPEMRAGRFLDGYRTREGLEWVLGMFSRRLPSDLNLSALSSFFFSEIEAFETDFSAFFPELQEEVHLFLRG